MWSNNKKDLTAFVSANLPASDQTNAHNNTLLSTTTTKVEEKKNPERILVGVAPLSCLGVRTV